MDILRLVTIHPILVHLTLGGIPLMLIAYYFAARTRSPQWLFAGDFILIATALVTVGTGLFGFVSLFAIDWPGGLDLWRWLHLALGVATAGIVWIMAILRSIGRKRGGLPNYPGLLSASCAAMVFATFAGWVGGEVLVYRSGVAVLGAQNGALAPPVPQARSKPRTILEGMGLIRAHSASALGEYFDIIVQRPTPDRFHAIEVEAMELRELSRWLITASEEAEGHHTHEHEGKSMHEHAEEFENEVGDLQRAAEERDLTQIAHAIDGVQSSCAGCHLEHRWREPEEFRAER
jgi:uncharacterized membrane protein